MAVWRSVRATGDTKTKRSRRTLALPARCVDVLSEHSRLQARMRAEAGAKWVDLGLVFTTRYGTPLDSADVRRDFRAAIGRAAGVDARQWTPRELRHSFVSLLSDSGVPIEEISRLVGHRSTVVTEVVYRKQLRPVLESGATVMDRLFAAAKDEVGGQFGGQDPSGTDEPGSLAEGTGLWPGVIGVGLGRLELPTSSLSGKRSNRLSYRPVREDAVEGYPSGAVSPKPNGHRRAGCAGARLSRRTGSGSPHRPGSPRCCTAPHPASRAPSTRPRSPRPPAS
jgi:integrase-like protein